MLTTEYKYLKEGGVIVSMLEQPNSANEPIWYQGNISVHTGG
jgi:hypothetical protein